MERQGFYWSRQEAQYLKRYLLSEGIKKEGEGEKKNGRGGQRKGLEEKCQERWARMEPGYNPDITLGWVALGVRGDLMLEG